MSDDDKIQEKVNLKNEKYRKYSNYLLIFLFLFNSFFYAYYCLDTYSDVLVKTNEEITQNLRRSHNYSVIKNDDKVNDIIPEYNSFFIPEFSIVRKLNSYFDNNNKQDENNDNKLNDRHDDDDDDDDDDGYSIKNIFELLDYFDIRSYINSLGYKINTSKKTLKEK